MWRQRSHIKWLHGDKNKKYFHQRACMRIRKNLIKLLTKHDGVCPTWTRRNFKRFFIVICLLHRGWVEWSMFWIICHKSCLARWKCLSWRPIQKRRSEHYFSRCSQQNLLAQIVTQPIFLASLGWPWERNHKCSVQSCEGGGECWVHQWNITCSYS